MHGRETDDPNPLACCPRSKPFDLLSQITHHDPEIYGTQARNYVVKGAPLKNVAETPQSLTYMHNPGRTIVLPNSLTFLVR